MAKPTILPHHIFRSKMISEIILWVFIIHFLVKCPIFVWSLCWKSPGGRGRVYAMIWFKQNVSDSSKLFIYACLKVAICGVHSGFNACAIVGLLLEWKAVSLRISCDFTKDEERTRYTAFYMFLCGRKTLWMFVSTNMLQCKIPFTFQVQIIPLNQLHLPFKSLGIKLLMIIFYFNHKN